MKHLLNVLFTMLLCNSSFAQNSPVDFEPGGNGANWSWTVFENGTNPALEILANPDPNGVNTSSTVAKFTALDAGQPFAGCETMQGSDIGTFSLTPETSTIKISVWKSVTSDVGIKLVDAGFGSLGEIKVTNTEVDQWQELTFDFSSMEGIEYTQLVVFPDFQDRNSDNIIYFDNIVFGNQVPLEAPMEPAPDPIEEEALVISMFSDVYTDVTVDTWSTEWSAANLEEIQIQSNDTKKYTSLDFVGIETTGANLIDASGMDFFHIDVWTPNVNTFRIKLVDFGADGAFEGGDDSEHELVFSDFVQNDWVSLTISLDQFEDLVSSENIAQLILSSADPSGSGVVYVDNVYFSRVFDSVEEEELGFTLQLSPNPTSDRLTVQSDLPLEKLAIYNLTGQIVLERSDLDLKGTIDLSNVEKGTYIVCAEIDGRLFNRRVAVD